MLHKASSGHEYDPVLWNIKPHKNKKKLYFLQGILRANEVEESQVWEVSSN